MKLDKNCAECKVVNNLKERLYDIELKNRWTPCKERLPKENEQMRRKMYGLQQTVENMKRKEERRYGRMVGEKRE